MSFASLEAGVVASEVLILSRGLQADGLGGYMQSRPSAERADFAAEYFRANHAVFEQRNGLFVTPTSYTPNAHYWRPPKEEEYEGYLMDGRMRSKDVPRQYILADSVASTTLEEVLYIGEQRPFGDRVFTPDRPLGLVAHDGQMDRGTWVTQRVLRLRESEILPLVVPGEDSTTIGVSEANMLRAMRVLLLGARSYKGIRRREQIGNRVFRLVVRGTYPLYTDPKQ